MQYIEFRVYLTPGADIRLILRAADRLQDLLSDAVSEAEAPKIFTQDVSYEISTTLVVPTNNTNEKVN